MLSIAVGLAALEHRIGFGGDGIARWPGCHMDMPRLGVGAMVRAAILRMRVTVSRDTGLSVKAGSMIVL